MDIKKINELFDDMCWEINHIKRKTLVKYKYLYIENQKETINNNLE
ncbi:MAG: hypothetical protein IKE75_02460 [Bacilli bacterium]|nr:hypothetical protein [Bacilli bacterium]